MVVRTTRWAGVVCGALFAGAGLGFIARDVLALGQPAVAIAWLVGAAVSVSVSLGRPGWRGDP